MWVQERIYGLVGTGERAGVALSRVSHWYPGALLRVRELRGFGGGWRILLLVGIDGIVEAVEDE
jgi:hypothetical protein